MKIFGSLGSTLNEMIFPVRCISCSQLGSSLCQLCRRGWSLGAHDRYLTTSSSGSIKVFSSVRYSTVAQKIILAAKESSIQSADLLVQAAIAHSVNRFLLKHKVDYLVPVPSRKSAVRLRGRRFVTEMCRELSREIDIPIADIVTHQRSVQDQSRLQNRQRWNNLEGSMVVKGGGPHPIHSGISSGFSSGISSGISSGTSRNVLLIDDLVTTGATLVEAARALRQAGFAILGAVTASSA